MSEITTQQITGDDRVTLYYTLLEVFSDGEFIGRIRCADLLAETPGHVAPERDRESEASGWYTFKTRERLEKGVFEPSKDAAIAALVAAAGA